MENPKFKIIISERDKLKVLIIVFLSYKFFIKEM